MLNTPSITSRLINDRDFRREWAPYILFIVACTSFIIWGILDIKRSAIAERDRLEQRLTAVERTLAELQDERRP